MPTLLIIGAGSDIGFPLARLYAECGYRIILASRSMEKLRTQAATLQKEYSVTVDAMFFDVLSTASHEEFYRTLPARPDVVITLAGILGAQSVSETNYAAAEEVIDANFTGLISILHLVAAEMETRKHGSIVGVSSVAGERGRKSNYVYAAAKAGFTAFLSGLRNRLHSSHVHVLTVHPGFIRTKMIAPRVTPRIITATPEEVARDIFRAQQSGKDFIYSRWWWRYIMLAFTMIPESIVKRLDFR